ncbi:hypothetical protein [Limosilactobacillus fermentum]|uniref:hypothetical protein n=1 Tax=Limosilactobacillus fermentum TaxID=1613 RepID=UPI0021824D26|nr:hypothetical protein [Limosilactobacillus fermentum]
MAKKEATLTGGPMLERSQIFFRTFSTLAVKNTFFRVFAKIKMPLYQRFGMI